MAINVITLLFACITLLSTSIALLERSNTHLSINREQ